MSIGSRSHSGMTPLCTHTDIMSCHCIFTRAQIRLVCVHQGEHSSALTAGAISHQRRQSELHVWYCPCATNPPYAIRLRPSPRNALVARPADPASHAVTDSLRADGGHALPLPRLGLQGRAGGGGCEGGAAGARRLPEDGSAVTAAQHDHWVPLSHRTHIQQAHLSLPGRPAGATKTLMIQMMKTAENQGGSRTCAVSAAAVPTLLETAAQLTV